MQDVRYSRDTQGRLVASTPGVAGLFAMGRTQDEAKRNLDAMMRLASIVSRTSRPGE